MAVLTLDRVGLMSWSGTGRRARGLSAVALIVLVGRVNPHVEKPSERISSFWRRMGEAPDLGPPGGRFLLPVQGEILVLIHDMQLDFVRKSLALRRV
jgi:hypothetical protein